MNQADGRWTIKCPAGTRADILRLAHAADLSVAQWLAGAVQTASTAAPAPAFAGELELRPGLLARHRAGGPEMIVIGPEPGARSQFPAMYPDEPPTGRWLCQWVLKGAPREAGFLPVALEPALRSA